MSKKKLKEEEFIAESFERAMEEGAVTDILGNKMTEEDFVSVNLKEPKTIRLTEVLHAIKALQGVILTIVDASYIGDPRSKYMKDLMRKEFVSIAGHLAEIHRLNLK